jgi:hypothetical protein
MSDTPERHPFKWTLGQIRKMNLELEYACAAPGCGWFGRYDLDALLAKFGPDFWVPEYPVVVCANCGGKDVQFQVACDHPPADGEQT